MRAYALGALVPFALFLILIALTTPFWPLTEPLNTFARMIEGVAPHLLVLALVVTCVIGVLGAKRLAFVMGICAVLGAAWVSGRHLLYVAPESPGEADFNLVWFNVLIENNTAPEKIMAALLESNADLIALTESTPVVPNFDDLSEVYPYRTPCNQICEIVVFSKYPIAQVPDRLLGVSREGRIKELSITPPGRAPVEFVITHLPKPWFFGFVERDDWHLIDAIRSSEGPLVVVGDLNAAPWSKKVIRLYQRFNLQPAAFPPATWPAKLGAFGVPIDHVMTRNGATIVSLEPWGSDLGSNHRGLRAEIALPPAP